MAVDTTMATGGIQRKQNGSMEVTSGSTLDIATGGVLKIESGGTFSIASGGVISVATGGELAVPVTVKSTTSDTITNYGVTTLGTTIASAYTIDAPDRAGLRKDLICTVHGASTVSQVLTFSGSCTMVGANGSTDTVSTITFTEPGTVGMVSLSTTSWGYLYHSGSVAFT